MPTTRKRKSPATMTTTESQSDTPPNPPKKAKGPPKANKAPAKTNSAPPKKKSKNSEKTELQETIETAKKLIETMVATTEQCRQRQETAERELNNTLKTAGEMLESMNQIAKNLKPLTHGGDVIVVGSSTEKNAETTPEPTDQNEVSNSEITGIVASQNQTSSSGAVTTSVAERNEVLKDLLKKTSEEIIKNTMGESQKLTSRKPVSDCAAGFQTKATPQHVGVDPKIKEKIWKNEYVDFRDLVTKDDKTRNVKLQGAEDVWLSFTEKPKQDLSFSIWTKAFGIFTSVYLLKFGHAEAPTEYSQLIDYEAVIRDLATSGADWRGYDEKFRKARSVDPENIPWDSINSHYYMNSFRDGDNAKKGLGQHKNSFQGGKNQKGRLRGGSQFVPYGSCRRFHQGFSCSGACGYSHQCYTCNAEKPHPATSCPQKSSPTTYEQRDRYNPRKPTRGGYRPG